MFIEPGTKIFSGVHNPHSCIEKTYELEKIDGTLMSPSGKKVKYSMLKCNKCGAIIMRGDKERRIEVIYTNYEFIHIPKKSQNTKPPTKKQIRNAKYLNACFIADIQGKPRPKKKGRQEKPCVETPDYVFKGEAPDYMKKNAFRPFQGGSFSPK